MMTLKIFTQPNCPKCPPVKTLANQLRQDTSEVARRDSSDGGGLKIELFDTSTVDGLAEGAFYSVMSTPSLILLDDKGKVVAEWRGEAPREKDVLAQFTARQVCPELVGEGRGLKSARTM